jgi:SPX domain protein involved in polyphosphate accumulation
MSPLSLSSSQLAARRGAVSSLEESGSLHVIKRYEFKYLIPERLVPAIRAVALTTSRIDEYAGDDGTYRIRSLYFDTDRFDLYWANDREQADRFKVRARSYPGKNSPVFLEVKRRVHDVIIKTRGAVAASEWREVLRGSAAARAHVLPGAQAAVDRFLSVLCRHHLRPVIVVEYEREAYVSDVDAYARLTFDRKVVAQPRETVDLEAGPHLWRAIDNPVRTWTPEPVCVLELKFERRPPAWMVSMVRRLELVRRSFSKYCYGVAEALTLPQARSAMIAGELPR